MTKLYIPLAFIGFSQITQAATVLVIDNIIETVGITPTIAVGTSGTKDNTHTWAEGVVGKFEVSINGAMKYMTVEATVPTGSLSAGTDSLMVVQTVGSQGLTDAATLSLYVSPSAGTSWTLDVSFKFWNELAATTPYAFTSGAGQFQITSLDIDYNQRYYTKNSTFDSNFTYSNAGPTNITTASAITGFTGFTAAPDADFSNPKAAVSSRGDGSQFDIRLAHNAVALFMFEFRDPSSIVPEPTVTLLGAMSALLLFRRRRA